MATTMSAREVLDREVLVIRSKLIEVAAALDRIDRAEGSVEGDAWLDAVRRSAQILLDGEGTRAEQIQIAFSLPYKDDWRRQFFLEGEGEPR